MQVVYTIAGVLRGRDFFPILPTGYGKMLCYIVLPAAFDSFSILAVTISSVDVAPDGLHDSQASVHIHHMRAHAVSDVINEQFVK